MTKYLDSIKDSLFDINVDGLVLHNTDMFRIDCEDKELQQWKKEQ